MVDTIVTFQTSEQKFMKMMMKTQLDIKQLQK